MNTKLRNVPFSPPDMSEAEVCVSIRQPLRWKLRCI